MTPNEQNEKISPNQVWGKYPCPPDLTHKVLEILVPAINFCNCFSSETLEHKTQKLCLYVESRFEECVLEGFHTEQDRMAYGIALGVVCRYRDKVIPPIDL